MKFNHRWKGVNRILKFMSLFSEKKLSTNKPTPASEHFSRRRQRFQGMLTACFRIERGPAARARDFGRCQGGEARASSQRAVGAEPMLAAAKSRALMHPPKATNNYWRTLTSKLEPSLLPTDYGKEFRRNFGHCLTCSFLAQPDFGAGPIQPALKVPRNPTFVLHSKFPGPLRHPLTKRPGIFLFLDALASLANRRLRRGQTAASAQTDRTFRRGNPWPT